MPRIWSNQCYSLSQKRNRNIYRRWASTSMSNIHVKGLNKITEHQSDESC